MLYRKGDRVMVRATRKFGVVRMASDQRDAFVVQADGGDDLVEYNGAALLPEHKAKNLPAPRNADEQAEKRARKILPQE